LQVWQFSHDCRSSVVLCNATLRSFVVFSHTPQGLFYAVTANVLFYAGTADAGTVVLALMLRRYHWLLTPNVPWTLNKHQWNEIINFIVGVSFTQSVINTPSYWRQSPRINWNSVPSVLWRCWLGGRKGTRPLKNRVVGCWHGYLSGARCRLAYGPADATPTHCLLLQ